MSTVLLRDRVLHRRELDVVPDGGQHVGGGHRTEHGLGELGGHRGMSSGSGGGQISGVGGLRVQVHRTGFRITGGLRVLFDELTTVLRVAGRERRLSDHVERRFIFHSSTTEDVRSRRQALEARGEERRHNGEGGRSPVQDGAVDGF